MSGAEYSFCTIRKVNKALRHPSPKVQVRLLSFCCGERRATLYFTGRAIAAMSGAEYSSCTIRKVNEVLLRPSPKVLIRFLSF